MKYLNPLQRITKSTQDLYYWVYINMDKFVVYRCNNTGTIHSDESNIR